MLALVYLVAITLANLLVVHFGPSVTVIDAFVFVGLDLTLRDRLHEEWHHEHLPMKMGALILAGGAISYALNHQAAQIALASTVAFVLAAALDSVTYMLMARYPRLVRVNASNIVGAATDSLVFPTLAFGALLPLVVLGQFAAKVAGGLLWSFGLEARSWKRFLLPA